MPHTLWPFQCQMMVTTSVCHPVHWIPGPLLLRQEAAPENMSWLTPAIWTKLTWALKAQPLRKVHQHWNRSYCACGHNGKMIKECYTKSSPLKCLLANGGWSLLRLPSVLQLSWKPEVCPGSLEYRIRSLHSDDIMHHWHTTIRHLWKCH